MTRCAILSCRQASQDPKVPPGAVSYHRFPPDPHIKEKWMEATGRKGWIPTKSSTICSKHFKKIDYIPMNSNRRFLKPGAIPTLEVNYLIEQANLDDNNPLSAASITATSTRKRVSTGISSDCTPKRQKSSESKENNIPASELCCSSRKRTLTETITCSSIKQTKISHSEESNRQKSAIGLSCNSAIDAPLMQVSTITSRNFIEQQELLEIVALQPTTSSRYIFPSAAICKEKSPQKPRKINKDKNSTELLPTSNTSSPGKRSLKNIITTKDSVIQKQRRQIRALQARNRRLKTKLINIEDVLKDLEQKFHFRNEDVAALESTNVKVQELIARYTDKGADDISRGKYPPALRSFALTLHFYSPKAYEYVRGTFNTCLPHPRTIQKWYENVDGEPGFTKESFSALKMKTESTNYPIIAGLVIDEMAIRRRVEWDGKKMHGYADIGNGLDGDAAIQAKEAFCFLVTAVNAPFKVPVGYFLVDGVSGRQRADLVKQCLERIHETGIKIISVTFDGCPSNVAMMAHLGCSITKPVFSHPVSNLPVACILDPSHMIKLVRNAFHVYKTFVDEDGKKVKWDYLSLLNTVQETEKFHLANKLRSQHIEYGNQKMKVKLASQLFSSSVADAIDFCREELGLSMFKDSEATTRFLRIMNNLFDIFNSRNMHQRGFKKALNADNASRVFSFLDVAYQYLSKLRQENGPLLINSLRKVGFLGFTGCMDTLRLFFTSLIESKELVFFPFYKVSQDHLELFFGNIRSHGGANNNPTARQFKAAYKKLLVHIEIKNASSGNCTALENISILSCTSAIQRLNKTTPSAQINSSDDEDFFEDDIEDDVGNDDEILSFYENLTEFSLQVICHIAGSVVHILMKRIKCDTCVGALLANTTNALHKFTIAKDKGGLLYASNDVIRLCKASEAVIRTQHMTNKIKMDELVNKVMRNFTSTNIFKDICFHDFREFPSSNHVADLMKAVIEKYISIRLHYLLKINKKQLPKRQLLNKYIIFRGE